MTIKTGTHQFKMTPRRLAATHSKTRFLWSQYYRMLFLLIKSWQRNMICKWSAMLWSTLRQQDNRQKSGIQVVEARSKWKRANASSKDIWKLHRANLYCSGSTSTAGCSLVDCIRRKTLSRIVSKLQAGRLGLAQVSLHPHRHQEHHQFITLFIRSRCYLVWHPGLHKCPDKQIRGDKSVLTFWRQC